MAQPSKIHDAKFARQRNVSPITLATARDVLRNSFRVQLNTGRRSTVINFEGEAGIGKTQSIKQVIRSLSDDLGKKVHLINWKLMTVEKEDVGGYPSMHSIQINDEPVQCFSYVPEARIAELARTGDPVVVFFDEWPRADRSVCSVMFSAIEDGVLGSFQMPSNWFIVAASNPSEGYQGNGVDSDHAYRRRFCWLACTFNFTEFIAHIKAADYHETVVAYCESDPKVCLDTTSRGQGFVYANPAAWEKISDYIKAQEEEGIDVFDSPSDYVAMRYFIGGLIGHPTADAFMKFAKQLMRTVTPDEVLQNYSAVRKTVQKLVKQGRTDILSALSTSVFTKLMDSRPDLSLDDQIEIVASDTDGKLNGEKISVSKTAHNIAVFVDDIPRDIAKAGLSALYSNDTEEHTLYALSLGEHLGPVPEFIRYINVEIKAQREMIEQQRAARKSS